MVRICRRIPAKWSTTIVEANTWATQNQGPCSVNPERQGRPNATKGKCTCSERFTLHTARRPKSSRDALNFSCNAVQQPVAELQLYTSNSSSTVFFSDGVSANSGS